MTIGKLTLLTGPAAVGKSTLAKALQAELVRGGELWLVLELDVFASGLPRAWLAWGDHRGRHAARGYVYTRAADGSVELTLGADGRRVLSAFHRSIAAVVKSGINVVGETIVHDEDDWNDWSEALQGIAPRWVKLTAPLAALESREAGRAAPAQGLARGMAARPPVGVYDLEVDTAAEPTAATVARVVALLR